MFRQWLSLPDEVRNALGALRDIRDNGFTRWFDDSGTWEECGFQNGSIRTFSSGTGLALSGGEQITQTIVHVNSQANFKASVDYCVGKAFKSAIKLGACNSGRPDWYGEITIGNTLKMKVSNCHFDSLDDFGCKFDFSVYVKSEKYGGPLLNVKVDTQINLADWTVKETVTVGSDRVPVYVKWAIEDTNRGIIGPETSVPDVPDPVQPVDPEPEGPSAGAQTSPAANEVADIVRDLYAQADHDYPSDEEDFLRLSRTATRINIDQCDPADARQIFTDAMNGDWQAIEDILFKYDSNPLSEAAQRVRVGAGPRPDYADQ